MKDFINTTRNCDKADLLNTYMTLIDKSHISSQYYNDKWVECGTNIFLPNKGKMYAINESAKYKWNYYVNDFINTRIRYSQIFNQRQVKAFIDLSYFSCISKTVPRLRWAIEKFGLSFNASKK